MSKNGEKIYYDKMWFDSNSELAFYKKLKDTKARKQIKDFSCNPEYIILDGEWNNWRGDKQKPIMHYPDYKIILLDNREIIVDTKSAGVKTHENDAILKKKIFEYLNREIPYYYISFTPQYLGGVWVESSTYHDFYTKLKSKYKALYPNENVRKHATCKKFLPKDWGEYYDFESVAGLFYIMHKQYTKKELEKMAKLKNK